MFLRKLFLISTVVVFTYRCCVALKVKAGSFFTAKLCDGSARIDQGCSELVRRADKPRSLAECTQLCNQEEFCAGANLDDQGDCFLHRNCAWGILNDTKCSVENTNHRYLAKLCVHGTWNVESQSCRCYKGTSGHRCEQYPKNCWDLETSSTAKGDHVTMFINPDGDGKTVFTVQCKLNKDRKARNTVFKSEGQFGSFNRTWAEYVNGFFIDDLNFWSGLNAWYKLTSSRLDCSILISITFSSGRRANIIYNHTSLLDESNNFVLTVGLSDTKGHHDLGDCLGPLAGTPFSTWDRDNDGDDTMNCAARAGSGWWWGSVCANPCHLLGLSEDFRPSRPAQELMYASGVDIEQLASNASRVEFVRIAIL